jgi:hypothetical protein
MIVMKTSSWAVVGAIVVIIITTVGLVVNSFIYGQSSNSLMLLMGFVGVQLPILLKMGNVETKVNGNYSEMQRRVQELESYLAEALKIMPPRVAADLPPLPDGKGDDSAN